MRRHFLSFASSDMRPALDRIRSQAAGTGFFDTVTCLDENGLDPAFQREFASHLTFGSRGYGYWCWKPQVCLQLLDTLPDGDVVIYADAGCHIHAEGVPQLALYADAAIRAKDGFLVFEQDPGSGLTPRAPHDCHEERWTKEDLFQFLAIPADSPLRTSNQVVSGIFAFRVGPISRRLFADWLRIYRTDFSLADDTPSVRPCVSTYREHRHDQSIFSLLVKSLRVERRSFFELTPGDYAQPLQPSQIAIVAARDRQLRFLSRKKRQWHKLTRKLRRLMA